MNKKLKLALILLIVTVISAGVLAFSNEMTADKIAEIKAQTLAASLENLFGEVDNLEEMPENDVLALSGDYPELTTVYFVEGKGKAIRLAKGGFDGAIDMIVGISDEDGSVLGVEIVSHTETAGLGSNIVEPEFKDQFIGESIDEESQADTISGATISSSAVKAGVDMAKEIYKEVN